MILGIGQTSENKFLSENMNVQKGMVALRMEMTVFKVMCQLILGHCDFFFFTYQFIYLLRMFSLNIEI